MKKEKKLLGSKRMLDISSALEYTAIKPQEVEVSDPIESSGAKLNGNLKNLFSKGKLSGKAEMS